MRNHKIGVLIKTVLGRTLFRKLRPLFLRTTSWINSLSSGFWLIFLSKSKRNSKSKLSLAVSMASFPQRFGIAQSTVKSILQGSAIPSRFVLVVSRSELNEARWIERLSLKVIKKSGVEVRILEENYRPFNKLVPIFEMNNAAFVTIDDDCDYFPWVLEALWDEHLRQPDSIIGFRGRSFQNTPTSDDDAFKYLDLTLIQDRSEASDGSILLTGVGAVLYPPSLSLEFWENCWSPERFLALSPTNDDLWMWTIERLHGTKVICLATVSYRPLYGRLRTRQLEHENVSAHKNDVYLKNLISWSAEVEQER